MGSLVSHPLLIHLRLHPSLFTARFIDTTFAIMPAVARIRTVRSLSPSLLTHMTHRYLPYHRTASPSSSTDIASEVSSVSSRDTYSCDRLNSLSISEKVCPPL
jgi:hypothetical protein